MSANRRLHSVLLTLWDIARDNPNYDRKLWGELQFCLSNLETRNNLLCALLGDLLQSTDAGGEIMWQAASIHSPPHGFAVKFMRDELSRERRPRMPSPPPVIPTNELGEAMDPELEIAPLGVDDEYDGGDESGDGVLLDFEIDLG